MKYLKGRIKTDKTTPGTMDLYKLPQGAMSKFIVVADQAERFALIRLTDIQVGDIVKQLDTGSLYIVVNDKKLDSEEGYTKY